METPRSVYAVQVKTPSLSNEDVQLLCERFPATRCEFSRTNGWVFYTPKKLGLTAARIAIEDVIGVTQRQIAADIVQVRHVARCAAEETK